jgi:hypothetical protein
MSARRFFSGSVEPLGDLEVLIIASTEQLAAMATCWCRPGST